MDYAQYVQDAGWDWTCIELTALLGSSEEDSARLARCGGSAAELEAYCQRRVIDETATTWVAAAEGSERYQLVLTRLQTIGPRCRGYDALPDGIRIYWGDV